MSGTMNPAIQASIHYGAKFDEIIAWYMLNGYVYSSPEVFVMACEHSKEALIEDREIKKLDKLDSWYIQYVAGEVKKIFDVCPFEKEWVIFERWGKSKRKVIQFSRIKQRFTNGRTKNTKSTETPGTSGTGSSGSTSSRSGKEVP